MPKKKRRKKKEKREEYQRIAVVFRVESQDFQLENYDPQREIKMHKQKKTKKPKREKIVHSAYQKRGLENSSKIGVSLFLFFYFLFGKFKTEIVVRSFKI